MQLAATFDLETSGLDPEWGRVLVGVIKPWNGKPEVYRMRRASSNDQPVVQPVIERLNEFSILIAHNGVHFDSKFLNGRALALNIRGLLPGIKIIDPCIIARKHLNLGRNSLDSIVTHLKLDEGKYHIPPEVWVKATHDHDAEAMRELVVRCQSDVRILEQVAARFLPLVRSINGWGSA